jgi:hypothetical protein
VWNDAAPSCFLKPCHNQITIVLQDNTISQLGMRTPPPCSGEGEERIAAGVGGEELGEVGVEGSFL